MSTPQTREQWVLACADRYIAAGGIDVETALYFAEACAETEQSLNGQFSAEWESPSDCADEDMSYWEEE